MIILIKKTLDVRFEMLDTCGFYKIYEVEY